MSTVFIKKKCKKRKSAQNPPRSIHILPAYCWPRFHLLPKRRRGSHAGIIWRHLLNIRRCRFPDRAHVWKPAALLLSHMFRIFFSCSENKKSPVSAGRRCLSRGLSLNMWNIHFTHTHSCQGLFVLFNRCQIVLL